MSKSRIQIHIAVLAFPVVASLFGCAASTQNAPGTFSHVAIPPSQIVRPVESLAGEKATIIVKRDPGAGGSALGATLTIDGQNVASLKAGQYYQFSIRPGEHLFGVRPTAGLGTVLADVHREVAVQATAGRTYILRLYAERGSGMHIQRSSL